MENKDTITQIEDVVVSDNQKYLIDKYETGEEPTNRVEYDVINQELKEPSDENYLYPHISDPNFSLKIANKKEFSKTNYPFYESKDIEEFKEKSNSLMKGKMIFSPHQIFVRNFLSSSTPYNSLLLFHGLGSGKTLTSIGVAEQYRQDMRNVNDFKTILVVASPNVQNNFRLQLFDERKLVYEDGIWTYDGNSNNHFLKELNPMGIRGLYTSKDFKKLSQRINQIIKQTYTFMGYRKFTIYIENIEEKSKVNKKVKYSLFKKHIDKEFSNRLVIIDEIHNIKKVDGSGASNKRVSKSMINVIKNSNNMRLLLLSATPMYNDYKEIVWLLNMMNLNDGRDEIYIKDIFDRNGNFNESTDINGKNILIQKSRGYISFVRGENPYTFPYRIFPSLHSPNDSILKMTYPKKQMNGNTLVKSINFIDLYATQMGSYQKIGYSRIKEINMSKIKDVVKEDNSVIDSKYSYTIVQPLIECLNFVFPNPEEDTKENELRNVLYGNNGIKTIMTFDKSIEQHYKKNYDYKPNVFKKYGRIFSYENIGKYSGKAENILKNIMNTEGVSIVYSQYIDSGILPMALALEEMGYKRYGKTSSLFDPNYIKKNSIKPVDFNHREKQPGNKIFKQAHYAVISGDNLLSPDNRDELIAATDDANNDGSIIKVIFISKAGSESLDFKFIRNIFVMDPWYNLSRIEQIIGRAVRFKSHKSLEFEKRNVSIYLYCSLPLDDDNETADLYIYRKAEAKAKQIGKITRVLKEVSVDCVLNAEQAKYTQENMNITINQIISNGKKVNYQIGDKPFSPNCDYMENCVYKCENKNEDMKLEISNDTFNEKLNEINLEIILSIIKDLFSKKYIYVKESLVKDIKKEREFLEEEIDFALSRIVENNSFIVRDVFDRIGYIVNVGPYYLYQPGEISEKTVGVFERITPVDNKLSHVKINVDLIDNKSLSSEKNVKQDNAHIDFYNKYQEIYTYCNTDINEQSDKSKIVYEYLAYNVLKNNTEDYNIRIANLCLLEYLFDRTNIDEKISILNDVWNNIIKSKIELNDFQTIMVDCLMKYHIKISGTEKEEYFIFENMGDYVVIVYEDKTNTWVKDNNTLKKYVLKELKKEKEITAEEFSNDFKKQYIGLVLYSGSKKSSKESKVDFKMKFMENKKSRSFSGIDYLKTYKIDMINNYLYKGQTIIKEKIGKNENFYNFSGKDSKFRVKALTVLMEYTYRYYDRMKYDTKRWFLDSIETIITKQSGTVLI